jgi:WD40 repeat protein
MSLWGTRAPATTTASNTQEADVELVEPPSDSISCIAFSPATYGEYLAVGAWDNTVCVFMSDMLFIYTVNCLADASLSLRCAFMR